MGATAGGSLILGAAATKKLVENVVTDLYTLAKEGAGFHLKKWKAANHADTIYKRIRQLRFVKTILQSEKEVDLTAFYYPSKLRVGTVRKAVHQLADLGYDGSVVLEGTVGQGKSILLRYLATTEFCTTRRIPVFVELRRLRPGQSIVGLALAELKALGFEMSEDHFHFFAEEGRLLLLLDAFDELKEELRQDAIAEIENLIRQHEALRVVVTSRPESGVSSSAFLRVFQLCPLERGEHEDVIRRMAHDEETADAIIGGIKKDAAQVVPLLTTPLMVALLMVRYKIDQSLPHNSAAFYESLFALLLQRHDKTKGGYVRPRKSGLGDVGLLDFFNALCFVTRKANEISFSRTQLNSFAREALRITGSKGELDKILADVIDITCLIITDGDECRFLHKSVQEYHAACFIKEQPDESASAFYQAMPGRWRTWTQELRFLSTIDRYRYLKFFYLEQLRKALELDNGEISKDSVTQELILRVCGKDKLNFRREPTSTASSLTVGSTGRFWPTERLIGGSEYLRVMFSVEKQKLDDCTFEKDQSGDESVKIGDLLKSKSCGKALELACAKLCETLQEELREGEQHVAHVEGMKAVFKF